MLLSDQEFFIKYEREVRERIEMIVWLVMTEITRKESFFLPFILVKF